MGQSRKLRLINWTKANDALNLRFEGNKSKLAERLQMSRTTVTAFFKQEPVREAEFRRICQTLILNWQEVSEVSAIASLELQTDWIEEVRSRCCQKILYQHGKIQLLNQIEIGVDELYVDVWLLNRSPRTFQVSESKMLESFDLRNDRLGLGDRIKRNEGMVVAKENSKLLILGKPGSGKTTFLKHLAVDCSNGKFQPDLIPVLIELRRIRSTEWQLLSTIAELLETDQPKTQELLEQGKLLILLDGLDEVSTSNLRREVQAQVSQFSQEPKYSNNRLILTCRTQIIEVIPSGFTLVEVADFNDQQVKSFVSNWFRSSGQTEADIDQQLQAFSEEIQKNSALKELTVTPVLLSLICLVLQDMGELPSQTAALYRKGIRLLLEKWNDRKDIPEWEIGKEAYRQLSMDQKEALLTEIAARKFENPENFVLFEQADLTQQIAQFLKLDNRRDAEAVLKAIEAQHGLLVERADELWSFSHLTFQEYFTAQWLTRLQNTDGLAEKISSFRWQTVAHLAVKSFQPADRLVRLIKQSIDRSISPEGGLQDFLTFVQTRNESNESSYKSTATRALLFTLNYFLVRERSHSFNTNYALIQDLDPSLKIALDSNQALKFSSDLYLSRALNSAHVLTHAFAHSSDLALDRARDFTRELDLYLHRAHAYDSILETKLQQLRGQLPTNSNEQAFRYWWRCHGQLWKQELRQVMVEHRNIGHDWKFTEFQKQSLQHYYDNNRFLVKLLKEPGAVSDPVRQEIEDNLLLPIATLKQRLPDQYS
jgi:predicted NACHT family NTPase